MGLSVPGPKGQREKGKGRGTKGGYLWLRWCLPKPFPPPRGTRDTGLGLRSPPPQGPLRGEQPSNSHRLSLITLYQRKELDNSHCSSLITLYQREELDVEGLGTSTRHPKHPGSGAVPSQHKGSPPEFKGARAEGAILTTTGVGYD